MKIVRLFRRFGIAAALLLIIVATACVPLPTDTNWGHLSLVGDPAQIMLAFHDRIVVVDPFTHLAAPLLDAQGNQRFDEQNNPRTWLFQVSSGQTRFYSTPLFADDSTMYAVSYDKGLFEIDFASARLLSSEEGISVGGQVVTDPVTDGERMYLGFTDANLIALDMTDLASRLWTFPTERGVWAQPLLVNGTLYVSSMDHKLYAVDAATGDERWRVDLGGAIAGTPLLYNDNLYVGSFARKIFQISLDGQITAEYPTTEWIWGTPAIVDDTLYVGDAGGWVYALALSGEGFTPVWSRQAASRAVRATPVVTETQVIVASRDHKVYWLDRQTGAEIRAQNTDAEILADMLVVTPENNSQLSEPYLIVSTMANDKLLFAYSLDTGDLRWRYPQQ